MFEERMAALGKRVGSRAAAHGESIERAREKAEALREVVLRGVDSFNAAAATMTPSNSPLATLRSRVSTFPLMLQASRSGRHILS